MGRRRKPYVKTVGTPRSIRVLPSGLGHLGLRRVEWEEQQEELSLGGSTKRSNGPSDNPRPTFLYELKHTRHTFDVRGEDGPSPDPSLTYPQPLQILVYPLQRWEVVQGNPYTTTSTPEVIKRVTRPLEDI